MVNLLCLVLILQPTYFINTIYYYQYYKKRMPSILQLISVSIVAVPAPLVRSECNAIKIHLTKIGLVKIQKRLGSSIRKMLID